MEPTQPTGSATLHCSEVWGGNTAADTAVAATGLNVWVYSRPYAGSEGGGDIHYLTLCSQGRIARFALADVSGHGSAVDALATTLRRQMRKSMNRLDQAGIARALNRAFAELAGAGRFATALLVTYDAHSDHLIICNAGHPRPLLRRAGDSSWTLLDADSACAVTDSTGGESGLPLGVIESTEYAQFAVPLGVGDVVLLYTDALIEAHNGDGRLLSEAGLADLLDGAAVGEPDRLVSEMLMRVESVRGGADAEDDVTILALHHHAGAPPSLTLLDRARSLSRLMGL